MKTARFFTIVAALLVMTGCEKALKSPEDYYPVVEMSSITLENDGSVTVTANIVSKGKMKGAELDYAGFCATSAVREPEMPEKQLIGTVSGNQIIASYPAGFFSEDSTYHISAWATNGHGYGISQSMSADSLFLDITPPCSFPSMYYDLAGTTGTFASVQSTGGFGEYEYSAMNGNYRYIVTFPTTPAAGIYSTNSYETTGKLKVVVYFSGSSYLVDNGQTVYVQKLNATTYRFTMCDCTFHYSSSTSFHVKGTFDFQP